MPRQTPNPQTIFHLVPAKKSDKAREILTVQVRVPDVATRDALYKAKQEPQGLRSTIERVLKSIQNSRSTPALKQSTSIPLARFTSSCARPEDREATIRQALPTLRDTQ